MACFIPRAGSPGDINHMKEIEITALQAGQRLDHLLSRYLKEAHSGFIYKMLRKKNITLNGKKATGSEKLCEGDAVRLFFADDTLRKFTGQAPAGGQAAVRGRDRRHAEAQTAGRLDVLYEDTDVLLVNKPAGMLTQKARPEDVSLNEYALQYLLGEGAVTPDDLLTFRPSVCNRLDRNTSGIVAIGKTIAGLQALSRIFRDRSVSKCYKALVLGHLEGEKTIDGWLLKDERTNKVTVLPEEMSGAQRIYTRYDPVGYLTLTQGGRVPAGISAGSTAHAGKGQEGKAPEGRAPAGTVQPADGRKALELTLLDVDLLTGRSHQIRAHLSSIGHPLAGDPKYGSRRLNDLLRRKYGITRQLLHAERITFPDMEGRLRHLSGRTFTAPLPEDFARLTDAGH